MHAVLLLAVKTDVRRLSNFGAKDLNGNAASFPKTKITHLGDTVSPSKLNSARTSRSAKRIPLQIP